MSLDVWIDILNPERQTHPSLCTAQHKCMAKVLLTSISKFLYILMKERSQGILQR